MHWSFKKRLNIRNVLSSSMIIFREIGGSLTQDVDTETGIDRDSSLAHSGWGGGQRYSRSIVLSGSEAISDSSRPPWLESSSLSLDSSSSSSLRLSIPPPRLLIACSNANSESSIVTELLLPTQKYPYSDTGFRVSSLPRHWSRSERYCSQYRHTYTCTRTSCLDHSRT